MALAQAVILRDGILVVVHEVLQQLLQVVLVVQVEMVLVLIHQML